MSASLPIQEPEPEEADALVSPYQPFDSAPTPGVRHPLAFVLDIALRKVFEEDRSGFLKLKPFGDPSNECGPEPEADPMPGREAQGRIAHLSISDLNIIGAGQTETEAIREHRRGWKRRNKEKQGALRRLKGRK